MSTHYSLGQKTARLFKWAEESAVLVDKLITEKYGSEGVPVFCYRGMSGVAHATALSLRWFTDHGVEPLMIYVRKPGEDSHGNKLAEYNLNSSHVYVKPRFVLVFVDDLIDSGNTRDVTLKQARAVFKLMEIKKVTRRTITVDKYSVAWEGKA